MTSSIHALLAHGPAIIGGGMFLVVLAACLPGLWSEDPVTVPGWLWWALVAGVLLAFRWPMIWLPHEIYPDESQLLAGAITLRHDPVFWRSVDGGTAGPLDYYALLPAAFFPGVASYAATRIIAAVLIWGGLLAVGGTLALAANRTVARCAVLPVLAFEAFTTSPEFVHYSTELLPGVLLAAAVYGLVRQAVRPAAGNLWLTALVLGAIPFAKLQAAPIAALLGLFLLGQELAARRGKNIGPVLIAALLPVLTAAAVVTATGQGENLLIPYFLQNMVYTKSGRQPVGLVLAEQWEQAVTNGYLALWLAGSMVFLGVMACLGGKTPATLRRLGPAVIVMLATAICCILAPGRPYNHYLNFLAGPVSLLLGVALASRLPPAGLDPARRRLVATVFVLGTLVPPIVLRASAWPDPYEYYNTVATAAGPAHRALVATVRALSRPGEALGIWGWRSSLYVETGLRQATRQAHSEAQFVAGPWQKYFLRCYFEDIRAAQPPVFVDAVGPGNFRFQDRHWGHEIFPLLDAWLRAHYTFVTDLDGTRVYARNDRLVPARPASATGP